MVISYPVLQSMFDALITGSMSREAVEAWADSVTAAEDRGDVEYVPRNRKLALWDAITFLTMVAGKVSPSEYMYDVDSIITYSRKLAATEPASE
jgi:hypothetical protein